MKRLLVLAFAIGMFGCGPLDTAKPGDYFHGAVFVRDLRTGKCIEIYGGKASFRVADDFQCRKDRNVE